MAELRAQLEAERDADGAADGVAVGWRSVRTSSCDAVAQDRRRARGSLRRSWGRRETPSTPPRHPDRADRPAHRAPSGGRSCPSSPQRSRARRAVPSSRASSSGQRRAGAERPGRLERQLDRRAVAIELQREPGLASPVPVWRRPGARSAAPEPDVARRSARSSPRRSCGCGSRRASRSATAVQRGTRERSARCRGARARARRPRRSSDCACGWLAADPEIPRPDLDAAAQRAQDLVGLAVVARDVDRAVAEHALGGPLQPRARSPIVRPLSLQLGVALRCRP